MAIVGDVNIIDGVIEAGEHDVRQRDLLHAEHVYVDRALVLARAFAVPLSPV